MTFKSAIDQPKRFQHSKAVAQTVVVDVARHVVQRVPEEVHVAALPCGLRQDLDDCLPEPGVVVLTCSPDVPRS
jgi:hypothetical protein